MNLINKIHENTIKKTSDVKLHKKASKNKESWVPVMSKVTNMS
jgi:hypothetical protein